VLKSQSAKIPGMTDTLDFVKNLWGSMNIPGANLPGMSAMSGIAAPTLSTEELDKRIADLKAVESWLNMNITMLRGTIHTLEVQRGTLATLKTMGASMAEAMKQSGVSAEKMANTPFAPFFGQGAAAASAPPAAAPAAPAAPLPTSGDTAQPGTAAAAGAAQDNPAGAAAMPAALAWWNLLQEQFTQAVATAMTPAPQAAGDKDKPAAAKPETPPPAQDAAPSGRTRASRARSDKQ